jgi:hypothetical protein
MRVLCVGAAYPPAVRGHTVRVRTSAGPACRGDGDVHRELVRFPVVPSAATATAGTRCPAGSPRALRPGGGDMVVNCSQGGGGKDVWVVDSVDCR